MGWRGISPKVVFYTFLLAAAFMTSTQSWAVDAKTCQGDLQGWLSPESIQPCLDIAKSDDIKPDVKSRIYLQLAVAQEMAAMMQGLNGDEMRTKALAFVDAAIASDPNYEEPYFFAARNFTDMEDVHSVALGYLERGIAANPKSAVLAAAKAYYPIPNANQNHERIASCDLALRRAPNDKTVQTMCGKVYFATGKLKKALRAFRSASVGYQPDQRRLYGVLQFPNPWFSLAQTYSRLGQPRMAVATLNQYWKRVPLNIHTADEYLELGDYLAASGKFVLAAAQYEKAIKLGPMLPVNQIKLRQLFYLSRSGNKALAREAAEKMLANADKKTVLQLQVALKNATGSNNAITGVFDENTKNLLLACLGNKKCQSSTESMHY